MFWTVSLSIIRSLTLHTAVGICHTGYADCCVYSARLLMMDRETVWNM